MSWLESTIPHILDTLTFFSESCSAFYSSCLSAFKPNMGRDSGSAFSGYFTWYKFQIFYHKLRCILLLILWHNMIAMWNSTSFFFSFLKWRLEFQVWWNLMNLFCNFNFLCSFGGFSAKWRFFKWNLCGLEFDRYFIKNSGEFFTSVIFMQIFP